MASARVLLALVLTCNALTFSSACATVGQPCHDDGHDTCCPNLECSAVEGICNPTQAPEEALASCTAVGQRCRDDGRNFCCPGGECSAVEGICNPTQAPEEALASCATVGQRCHDDGHDTCCPGGECSAVEGICNPTQAPEAHGMQVADSATPCCDKTCELPLVKYFSTDAPHGFCGEACMDPKKFNIYHKFEANLTLATEDHPCREQRTPDNTKHYTDYFSTVTHGLPGVLAVTLDLYAPKDMPDHSCCSSPLLGGINCVGKPNSVTISGTGPFCCPSSATGTTPCAKEEAQYVDDEPNNKKEIANISCHYLYVDPTSRNSAQISCKLFENFGVSCPKTVEPDSCTAVGYPVCCALEHHHNIQSWHTARWGCNYNQVKCGSQALTGDKAILI